MLIARRALGTTFAPRPGVSQEQEQGKAQRQAAADEEFPADGPADEESRIDAEGLHEKASEGVEAHVEHRDIPVLQTVRKAAGHPQQYKAYRDVPDRLVQEGRGKSLSVRISYGA